MVEEPVQRRLAAILTADIVGYSRLIRADEVGTLTRVKSLRRDMIEPIFSELDGRTVKLMGDGMLVEFGSVVDAVRAAVKLQLAIARHEIDEPESKRVVFRVGINLGDVVIDGDDIHGDGVNVAARLEGLAKPGGICVSGNVYDEVRDRTDLRFEDMGDQEVKNIERPVRVWRWIAHVGTTESVSANTDEPLPLPHKPSIAVLPFDNMSGDPEQEHFGDGIAEDVITALSRFRSLFVIARNSSFTYKGQAVGITQLAKDLGVRYVVEGSVRKAGNRVRITAQLIDAISGNHLWADRFDGSLDDVFDLQDRITERIVVAVEPEIEVRERERARRKRPENLDAWELFQRGLSHFYRANASDRADAIRLFKEAVVRDPEFAMAHAHIAYVLWASRSVALNEVEDATKAMSSAREAAERAISLDPNEPMAHFSLGRLHIFAGEADLAIAEMQNAITINPNLAIGHYGLGFAYHTAAGQVEKALPCFDVALRLNPRGPLRWATLMLQGSSLRFLGRHEEAVERCRQACQIPDNGSMPFIHLAAAAAEGGLQAEARKAVETATKLQPALSLGFFRSQYDRMHEATLNSLLDSLRKAGVPE